jgi:predicted nucleic acid-binding protein
MSLADESVGLLDADTLFAMPLCDTLLSLAEAGLFLPRWSAEILEEVRRNLVESGRCTPAQALRRIRLMNEAFPEALVEGHESLIEQMHNDPKDRHVLAAGVYARADVIVTQNVRHFPHEALSPWDIWAANADRFLLDLLEAAPENEARIVQCIADQAHLLSRPQMTHHQVLDRLAVHAPAFAARVRELIDRDGFSLLRLEDR